MRMPSAAALCSAGLWVAAFVSGAPALAHPGSGIAVDQAGNVYFVDTGAGVWKIDSQRHVTRLKGPAYHFMAMDGVDRLVQAKLPRAGGEEVELVGSQPALILASGYPIAVSAKGDFFYPAPNKEHRVQIWRFSPPANPQVLATLPEIKEIDAQGKTTAVPWIHGLAAPADGAVYYTEQRAVRRISADGAVTTIAENVTVPDCERPSLAKDERLGPALRGLDVRADGTVFVAASACSAVLKITPRGEVSVVLRATDSWSPTGVAVSGGDLYVLEYLHINTERRAEWLPRVRMLATNGTATILCNIER
jgi:DNA-binding beta-propeller fold protein YncE